MRTIYFEKSVPKILLTKTVRPLWPGAVYSFFSPTRLDEIEEPALPAHDWVRVSNLLCGICASDLHLLFVETDPKVAPAALPGLERIYLGHEVVGEVTEIGPNVKSTTIGDRVVMDSRGIFIPNCVSQGLEEICRHCRQGNHGLCENASLAGARFGVGGGWGDGFTAHESEVYKVPASFDDEVAMMIEPLSVGVRSALRRLPLAGEIALVLGCGIVGLNVIQSLRALSPECRIVAMARHAHQADMARRLGADQVSTEDVYSTTINTTSGKLYSGPFNNQMILGGFDVIFDCVGSAQTVRDSLRATRAGGTVVVVGVSLETLKLDLTPIWYQEVDLIGALAHGTEIWRGTPISTYDLVCELLTEERLTIDGLITHSFRLEQWQEAIKTATDKGTGAIKVMFDYRGSQG